MWTSKEHHDGEVSLSHTNKQLDNRFNEFVTELKKLSDDCEFGTIKGSLVKDIIICGVNDSNLRERLLREDDVDLAKVVKVGQAAKQTKLHAQKIREAEKSVYQLKYQQKSPSSSQKYRIIKECKFCW